MAANRFKATLEKMIEREARLDAQLQEELEIPVRQINSFRQACKDLPLTKDNLIPDSEDDEMVSATICQLEFICGMFRWYPITWDGNDICFGLVNGLDSKLGYFSLRDISKVNPQLKKDFRKQPYQCLEMKPCDSSDSEPSSPTLPVKSFLEVQKSIMGDDYDCLICNVFDHFRDDELRNFREHIDEDMDKATFMHKLENHILYSMLVLRYGEGAKEQMEQLWVSLSDKSEASTPTSPVESLSRIERLQVKNGTHIGETAVLLEKQRDEVRQEFFRSACATANLLELESEVTTPTSPVYTRPPGEKAFKAVRVLMNRVREDLDSIAELVLCLHFENVELKEQLQNSA